MLLDTRHSLETPEGASLPLTPAGFGVRCMAQCIDFLIRVIAYMLISIPVAFIDSSGGLLLILVFLLEWFYPVFFEVTRHGRTPGKKSMGIHVINDDATPVTFAPSLLRNLLRVVDWLPFFYLTGIISSVLNRQFKRLGDLAAGTMVVYDIPVVRDPSFDIKGQLAVPSDFSTEEQRAILAFAERSKYLSNERQSELAVVLQPVIAARDPVVAIKQMANSLVGKY